MEHLNLNLNVQITGSTSRTNIDFPYSFMAIIKDPTELEVKLFDSHKVKILSAENYEIDENDPSWENRTILFQRNVARKK